MLDKGRPSANLQKPLGRREKGREIQREVEAKRQTQGKPASGCPKLPGLEARELPGPGAAASGASAASASRYFTREEGCES